MEYLRVKGEEQTSMRVCVNFYLIDVIFIISFSLSFE